MSKSNYLEAKMQDHVLGGPNYVRPATVYVAMHTGDPSEAGGANEATGPGYARTPVTNDADHWPAATGTSPTEKSNGVEIETPAALSEWSSGAEMTHFSLYDALEGGNMLIKGPLQTPKQVLAGDQLVFPPGSLKWTED